MKRTMLGLALAMFAGAAAAGDLSEPRYYESNDYSAQVFYRVEFGGTRGHAQSVGLRFDSVKAEAAGAPSLLQVRFGEQGLDRLAVSGVDLRGAMLASGQSEGGFMSQLGLSQWIALGWTAALLTVAATDALDDDTSGTGGS